MKLTLFMTLSLTWSNITFGAKTPAIKNYRLLAKPLDHKITDVTTYSDRAKVVRRSKIPTLG